MLLLNNGEIIGHIPPIEDACTPIVNDPVVLIVRLVAIERRAIESAMILCSGNRRLAAFKLGISQTCLRNKLNSYRVGDGDTTLPDMRGKTTHAAAGG